MTRKRILPILIAVIAAVLTAACEGENEGLTGAQKNICENIKEDSVLHALMCSTAAAKIAEEIDRIASDIADAAKDPTP